MDLMTMAELLGNLGEFLAALAVLVTLIYLAIQTRLNTQAVRGAAAQASVPLALSHFHDMYSNPDLEELYFRRINGEELEAAEKRRVNHYFNALLHSYESFFLQQKQSSIDPELWEGKKTSLDAFLQNEAFIDCWHGSRFLYSPSFKCYVDSRINEGSSAISISGDYTYGQERH